MPRPIRIEVTFPDTKKTRWFKSIRAVSRMLSGDGTASGGLRQTINNKASRALQSYSPQSNNRVRRNRVFG